MNMDQKLSARVPRRAVLKMLAGLPVGLSAWSGVAKAASEFPSRPIRLIVPFAAGGGADVMARILARTMGQRLGRVIIVDNVTGAGGTIGANQLALATPDGYTLMTGTPSTILINPAMQPGLRYQPDKNFAPISQFSDSPAVLIVNKDQPWRTVRELISAVKAKPGSVNFGSAGVGSFEHLSGELFNSLAGVKMVHVPYRGTAQSLTDLRAGSIQVLFENLPPVLGPIRGGEVRALGMGSAHRSSFLPDVPTIAEAGVPGYESTSWLGLFAPAATPAAIIDVLQRAAIEAARDPQVVEMLRDLGADAVGSDPTAFGEFIAQRKVVIDRLVKSSGIHSD
jgi:tripartite-type tricarboxylate transporter receptor subunit TctC